MTITDIIFIIPHQREELTTKQNRTDYVVEEIFPVRLLPTKLSDAKGALKTFGKETVIENFDSLLSVICQPARPTEVLERAWNIVLKYAESMHRLLKSHFESAGPTQNNSLRNSLSMVIYLCAEYSRELENNHTRLSVEQVVAGKKKKGRRADVVANDSSNLDWPHERQVMIRQLSQICLLPVQRLWDPPSVEQSVINCIGTLCFKLLENSETLKMKDTKEEIFRLLALLVKRHQYSLNVATQIIESLRINEGAAVTMAQVLAVIAREFGFKATAHDVMKQISSQNAEYLMKDSAATRAYSLLLTELAEMIPDIILPMISVLLPFLEADPYMMRSAVLIILGKLVMNLLTGEKLDENQKRLREEFLDTLLEHFHDANSHVRSKVLQVMMNIVEAKALPISRFSEVANLSCGRILDRSSNVRRYALKLLTTLITHNPYGAQLTSGDLVGTLAMERQKLATVQQEHAKLAPGPVISYEENWDAMEPEIFTAVEEYCETMNTSRANMGDESDDTPDTVDCLIGKINSSISQCLHSNAIRLFMGCQSMLAGTQFELPNTESSEDESNDGSDLRQSIVNGLNKIFLSQTSGEPEPMELSEQDRRELQENLSLINTQKLVVKYLEESYQFAQQIHGAMPNICRLLLSKSQTDVIEGIQFVITVVQFGLGDSMKELATMLKLVWINDKAIKEAVVNAFKVIFLETESDMSGEDPEKVAKSLITQTRTYSELFGAQASWEELVAEFVRSGEISSKVLQLLWQMFTLKRTSTTPEERHASIQLLGMAARAEPSIVATNLDVLISDGLQEGFDAMSTSQFYFVRDVCMAILTMTTSSKEDQDKKSSLQKLSVDHQLVLSLSRCLVSNFSACDINGWVPMMEQIINVIYCLTETPDKTVGDIIKSLYEKLLAEQAPNSLLTRFVALVGQVIMCQIIYLEKDVLHELKAKKPEHTSRNASETNDELGTTTTDDLEQEIVLRAIETELLNDGNLLGNFLPMLGAICNNQQKFTDEALQAAVTLALGKYMLVNAEVCQSNLQLYFTLLEKSKYESVKTNAIVALSDLVFKFPNELEPWTPHLYARLRDDSHSVRKSTLIVMTRLILNDMVKVKGQISELATCLVDPKPDIQELAKQFFTELATKGRALYNVILDMVSRLSDPEVGVSENQFVEITSELFGHIKNEKLCSNLTERLLLRFQATEQPRQWIDLAFCISRLSHGDKSIKKLMDSFPLYADKLGEPKIYEYFNVVIATVRGKPFSGKATTKEMLTELQNKIQIAHTRGAEDLDALENAEEVAQLLKPRNKVRRRKTMQSQAQSNSDSDSSLNTTRRSVASQRPVRKSTRVSQSTQPVRGVKTAKLRPLDNLIQELSEESDSSEDEAPKGFTRSRKLAAAKDKKKLSFSSSDEEETNPKALTPRPRRTRKVVS